MQKALFIGLHSMSVLCVIAVTRVVLVAVTIVATAPAGVEEHIGTSGSTIH